MDSILPWAAVVYANYYQFHEREVRNPRVRSRMLLWCKSGSGRVVVNGAGFDLHPEDFLFLPWAHSILYTPNRADPFLVAGIHLIPYHSPDAPMDFAVPHSDRTGPYFPETIRRDAAIPGFETLYRGSFLLNRSLEALAEYIVASNTERPPEEIHARRTAALLVEELRRVSRSGIHSSDMPLRLVRLLRHADAIPLNVLSSTALARGLDVSLSTVNRLFRTHLHMSVGAWIAQRRMDTAARLLKSTDLPIGEVGAKSGIVDPYYFSRLFRKHHGMTAGEYRRRYGVSL